MDERREDPGVEDLDVSEAESEDVKGGALNAYISSVTGEKQGGAEPAGNYSITQAWPKKYSG